MATGTAAAIPVPGGGPVQPPAIIIPELPDATALTSVVNTPGGVAAALLDIYGHMKQMGASVSAVLQEHFSSNSINNDQLEQQIDFNRIKSAEHELKLEQASGLIGDLRTSNASIKAQLAEASSKFASLEGQFKILAMRGKDGLSLARDERCRSLGLLGSVGANAPVYK